LSNRDKILMVWVPAGNINIIVAELKTVAARRKSATS
jgi:hypothetical protein